MKNHQTPRTLADCEFTVGHRQAVQREGRAADFILVVLLAFVAGALIVGVL